MIQLSDRALSASKATNVKPNLVFGIDGYENVFGALSIQRLIRIGDTGLVIGDAWQIGGLVDEETAKPFVAITLGGGTSSRFTQQVAPDKAQGISITSMMVQIVDKGELATQLISPGVILEDILGRDASIRIGFAETAYPEDYDTVFRGVIQSIDAGPGVINFNLASSEEKKRRPVFSSRSWPLSDAVDAGTLAEIPLDNPTLFSIAVNGPDGSPDSNLEFYVRIQDEVLKYTGRSGTGLTGVSRAQLGTVAAAHDAGEEASSIYHLSGDAMTLALKIMLSGWNDYFVEDVDVTSIEYISASLTVSNALYFDGVDVEEEYGLVAGDYVTLTGTDGGTNDFTLKQISSIVQGENGSYIVISGVTLVTETTTSGVVSFRSKYDTLGQGLKLKPADVDVEAHEYIRDTYLSAFDLEFWIDDIPNSKDWIEQELYLPAACFSIFRKGRSSVAIHVGPLTSSDITELNRDNVTNAQTLRISRSLTTNFSNTVKYHFDYDLIEDKFKAIRSYESTLSKARISAGDKVFDVPSRGMTTANSAETLAQQAAEKFLGRYQYGAQFIKGMNILFKDGYPLEIGDIVLVDMADLQLTDTSAGSRAGGKKLFEVLNKQMDIKTGMITIDVVLTQFSTGESFALIAPSSLVDAGAGTEDIPLKKSWGTLSFESEGRKWEDYVGQGVVIHSPDWSYEETSTIDSVLVVGDVTTLTVSPALSVAPSEDYIIEPEPYADSTDSSINLLWKGEFAHFSPRVAITAGVSQTVFEVDAGDIDKFIIGAPALVHSEDYTDLGEEALITDVDTGTNRVTIDTATGFTINNTHLVDLLGFKDGGLPYRWL